MTEQLLEMFRFHAWGTARLLAFCEALPPETAEARTSGTFGTLLETFSHVVGSDSGYIRILGGDAPARPHGKVTLPALGKRAARNAEAWEAVIARGVDPSAPLLLDKGTFECPASVVVTQALHHGDLHREQICAILTAAGVQPPDLQPWTFAEETARARFVTATT
jgi:uncharacterized damage-inducible protein DinB